MRVMRGKTFEGKKGVWEKIEVELDGNDLLPDEQAAADHVKLQLLEVRADKHLLMFLKREGQISSSEAQKKLETLDGYKKRLLKANPSTVLRRRRPSE